MRAVVVIEEAADRDSVARVLQRAGFSVVIAADRATAVAAVVRDPPETVVFSWTVGADFVRDVRAADTAGKSFLLALVDSKNAGSGISPVLASGVHDVLIRPFVDAELVARLRAASRAGRRASPPAPASQARTFDVRRLGAWRNLGSTVATDLEEMVGESIQAMPGWPRDLGQPLRCATIPMSLVHEGVELMVSVAADPSTQAWLARALLQNPAPGEAALNDVMRELASTAGGALKRMALQEQVTMTTGLPVNVSAVAPAGENTIAFGLHTLHAAHQKATLALAAEVQKRVNRQVKASELREGMVVVHDVRSPSGVLLVTAGSRLTRTTAERLRGFIGPKSLVEVA